MKKKIVGFGFMVLGLATLAFADFRTDLSQYFITQGLPKVGARGTNLRLFQSVTLTFANASSTSETCLVTGMLPTDKIIATANSKPTNASYITSIVPGTGSCVVWYNTDPGSAVTIEALITRR